MTSHYTIKPGDSMRSIAAMWSVDQDQLIRQNIGTLNAAAISHGYPSSDHGTMIFPGTTLSVMQGIMSTDPSFETENSQEGNYTQWLPPKAL